MENDEPIERLRPRIPATSTLSYIDLRGMRLTMDDASAIHHQMNALARPKDADPECAITIGNDALRVPRLDQLPQLADRELIDLAIEVAHPRWTRVTFKGLGKVELMYSTDNERSTATARDIEGFLASRRSRLFGLATSPRLTLYPFIIPVFYITALLTGFGSGLFLAVAGGVGAIVSLSVLAAVLLQDRRPTLKPVTRSDQRTQRSTNRPVLLVGFLGVVVAVVALVADVARR